MPYSMEFRAAVANAYDECGSSAEAAELFGCRASWARRLIRRRRERGSLEPPPARRPDDAKPDDADERRPAELIARRPDMALAELAGALGNKVGVPTAWRATQGPGLPLEKRPCTPPPSGTAPTWPRRGRAGSAGSPASGSRAWPSSTSSGRRRT